ncbi:MAG: sigma-54 dependent transcriptional regulator [Polyangiaceae bacterium]
MRPGTRWGDKPASVLVVEDDASLRFGLCGALRAMGLQVHEADSRDAATRVFAAQRPDVVLTDLRLPDGDALELLPRIRAIDPAAAVIIMTGHGSIDLAVRAVKQGAEDFLTKPVDTSTLGAFLRSAIDRRRQHASGVRAKLLGPRAIEPRSSAMGRVEEQIERLRDADCTVLLLGETGTGKSVLARRIHAIGARSQAPFVDINCAGLTKEFVESELFGHERGAFTGAHNSKEGLLDAASGGTFFLDEIGDMDVLVQPKLLKVLEEKRFRRMGGVHERAVDIRLIGATHHDLLAAVSEKRFRADLYYRISTVSITVPSLRERREDLVPLAYQVLADLGAEGIELTVDAKEALLDHPWPGNLRELKNVLERALLRRDGDGIRADDIAFDTPSVTGMLVAPIAPSSGSALGTPAPPSSSARTLSEVEREHIEQALLAERGRVEAAARRLGIPRSTLYQRIKGYGIDASKLRRGSSSVPDEDGD